MTRIYIENVVKNALLLLVLGAWLPDTRRAILGLGIERDDPVVGALLVAVSIVSVTACFGNFAFTYETIPPNNLPLRLLAHLTTALLMLIIGASLYIAACLTHLLIGEIPLLDLCWGSLYLASVLYDFLDLQRIVYDPRRTGSGTASPA